MASPVGQSTVKAIEQEQESDPSSKITELDSKIKLLYFKLNKTDEVIQKQKQQTIERLRTLIVSIVNAVDMLKSLTRRVKSTIKVIDIEEQNKRAVENHKQKMEFESEVLE